MRDGTRKVIQISEVVGVRPDNPNEPLLNDLFIFDIDDEPEYDRAGHVVRIKGKHKRVGRLSDKTIRKFKLEGVSTKLYRFLLEDPGNDSETYTGQIPVEYGV